MKTIVYYYTQDGECPYLKWFNNLDNSIKVRIEKQVRKVIEGNYADHKPLQNSELSEIRMNFGKGYRIYYYDLNSVLVLFVGGSEKKDQKQIINKCNSYFNDFIRRNSI